jgi:hypothetical protein
MPRGFGRLPFLARRDGSTAQSRLDASAGSDPRIDDDDAPVGPPVLLPAMIHRMILVDRTELTPVWARPRPPQPAATAGLAATAGATEPDVAVSSVEPTTPEPSAPETTRKRKASDSSGGPKAPAAPRNPRKPAANRRRPS